LSFSAEVGCRGWLFTTLNVNITSINALAMASAIKLDFENALAHPHSTDSPVSDKDFPKSGWTVTSSPTLNNAHPPSGVQAAQENVPGSDLEAELSAFLNHPHSHAIQIIENDVPKTDLELNLENIWNHSHIQNIEIERKFNSNKAFNKTLKVLDDQTNSVLQTSRVAHTTKVLLLSQKQPFSASEEQSPIPAKVQNLIINHNYGRPPNSSPSLPLLTKPRKSNIEAVDPYTSMEVFDTIQSSAQPWPRNSSSWKCQSPPENSEIPDSVWSFSHSRALWLKVQPTMGSGSSSMKHEDNYEHVIVLVGPSGAGKTNFVANILGESGALRNSLLNAGKSS
jgi:hypothetical protein